MRKGATGGESFKWFWGDMRIILQKNADLVQPSSRLILGSLLISILQFKQFFMYSFELNLWEKNAISGCPFWIIHNLYMYAWRSPIPILRKRDSITAYFYSNVILCLWIVIMSFAAIITSFWGAMSTFMYIYIGYRSHTFLIKLFHFFIWS